MSSDSTLEQSDVQAVDAIRGGDAERYRELVKRYERRVYALAWSRLGDPHLAEEATQETFIRGYRRLWLLGDGSRFAGWIMSIARHAAINLGVRRRRELDKRRRWALDPSVHPEMTESGDTRVCAPEMLRQTLVQLPPAHRECLVLFYLEGKSGAETAAALGISESALRVRLHRARAALREQLEGRLAASLENLRPGRALAPAIMATVLASSSTKAAAAGGTGGAIVGALAKFAPLKWVFPFASLIMILPMVLLSWFFTQREIRNFRDPKGFRARLFREVFVVPPGRTLLWRWFRVGIVLLILGGLLIALKRRPWLEGLKPVQLSESDIRAFLNDTTPNPEPGKLKFNSATAALFRCLVLPPTNLFTADGLRGMRAELFRDSGLTSNSSDDLKISWLCHSALARRAMTGGWIGWADLGIAPAAVSASIHEHQAANAIQFNREFLLTREEASSWVDRKRWPVQRVTQFTMDQLRWLRDVNCLDLVDRTNLARHIASVQVLSATSAPGQPTIHDWRAVRGLFFTPGWPALEDTYASLAALEILGGLDRIDREQCIHGILRRHQGKGYFTSPDSGGFNEYHIAGGARDTFCAFESLRILGTLDRVNDLERWQFRIKRVSKSAAGVAPGGVTWDAIEAWVCQRRFQRATRERQENPQVPVRSSLRLSQPRRPGVIVEDHFRTGIDGQGTLSPALSPHSFLTGREFPETLSRALNP